jgi:hypothetical protein
LKYLVIWGFFIVAQMLDIKHKLEVHLLFTTLISSFSNGSFYIATYWGFYSTPKLNTLQLNAISNSSNTAGHSSSGYRSTCTPNNPINAHGPQQRHMRQQRPQSTSVVAKRHNIIISVFIYLPHFIHKVQQMDLHYDQVEITVAC